MNPFRYKGYYYDAESGMYYCNSRYYVPDWGRWLNYDSANYIDWQNPLGINAFSYCNNNPINYYDPSGHYIDTILDFVFILWDIWDLCQEDGYKKWGNWVSLGIDLVFAVIPFVTGGGQIVKIGNKIDDAYDVAKMIGHIDDLQDARKITIIGRNMDRVKDTASLIGHSDDLYKAWKGYDTTAKGLKRILHDGYSIVHDGAWMFGKLRTGYTVIDIGIKSTMHSLGRWYGIERFVCFIWQTRNIWKWIYHLLGR